MTPEGKIVAKLKTYLKARKVKFLRLTIMPGAEVGWPDLLICGAGGLPLLLEVKAPGETPRVIQAHRMAELEALGYMVAWADNYDACVGIVNGYLITCASLRQ